MTIGIAIGNLRESQKATSLRTGLLLKLMLRLEAWFDHRASRRSLYGVDDRGLADLGLRRTDVEGYDHSPAWPDILVAPRDRGFR